jgi:origin recognition complex subunit 1
MPSVTPSRPSRGSKQAVLPGVAREDSDDELGVDDHPWEWIHADTRGNSPAETPSRKRKRALVDEGPRIIGARMGSFVCHVGDIVLLKAETTGEAWVAIIREFLEDEDGETAADFLWFSSEKEIRNKDKKRTDFLWVSSQGDCRGKEEHNLMTNGADPYSRTSCTLPQTRI